MKRRQAQGISGGRGGDPKTRTRKLFFSFGPTRLSGPEKPRLKRAWQNYFSFSFAPSFASPVLTLRLCENCISRKGAKTRRKVQSVEWYF
jgi:hypothetical protein